MFNLNVGIMYGVKGKQEDIYSVLQEEFPDTYEEEWENLVEQGHIIESEFFGDDVLIGYKPKYIDTEESEISELSLLSQMSMTHLWEGKYNSFMESVFWSYERPKSYFFNYWR